MSENTKGYMSIANYLQNTELQGPDSIGQTCGCVFGVRVNSDGVGRYSSWRAQNWCRSQHEEGL